MRDIMRDETGTIMRDETRHITRREGSGVTQNLPAWCFFKGSVRMQSIRRKVRVKRSAAASAHGLRRGAWTLQPQPLVAPLNRKKPRLEVAAFWTLPLRQ